MAKTIHAILKQALFDILANTKGAYTGTLTLELTGTRPFFSSTREVSVDLSSQLDEYKEPLEQEVRAE